MSKLKAAKGKAKSRAKLRSCKYNWSEEFLLIEPPDLTNAEGVARMLVAAEEVVILADELTTDPLTKRLLGEVTMASIAARDFLEDGPSARAVEAEPDVRSERWALALELLRASDRIGDDVIRSTLLGLIQPCIPSATKVLR